MIKLPSVRRISLLAYCLIALACQSGPCPAQATLFSNKILIAKTNTSAKNPFGFYSSPSSQNENSRAINASAQNYNEPSNEYQNPHYTIESFGPELKQPASSENDYPESFEETPAWGYSVSQPPVEYSFERKQKESPQTITQWEHEPPVEQEINPHLQDLKTEIPSKLDLETHLDFSPETQTNVQQVNENEIIRQPSPSPINTVKDQTDAVTQWEPEGTIIQPRQLPRCDDYEYLETQYPAPNLPIAGEENTYEELPHTSVYTYPVEVITHWETPTSSSINNPIKASESVTNDIPYTNLNDYISSFVEINPANELNNGCETCLTNSISNTECPPQPNTEPFHVCLPVNELPIETTPISPKNDEPFHVSFPVVDEKKEVPASNENLEQCIKTTNKDCKQVSHAIKQSIRSAINNEIPQIQTEPNNPFFEPKQVAPGQTGAVQQTQQEVKNPTTAQQGQIGPFSIPSAPAANEPNLLPVRQLPETPKIQAPAPKNNQQFNSSVPEPVVVQDPGKKEISINFNNVLMIEYIRFISKITNKNFIFDEADLQFNVTIVSEEPTTVENLMAALLQELRIRNLSLLEQGNNIIIHRNPRVRGPSQIVSDGTSQIPIQNELVTRVFRLNTLDPSRASEIIRPLLSDDALIEVLGATNNLIITDLASSVNKIAQLIGTLDAPNSGVTIGQYVVRNTFVDSLAILGERILQPIAQGNPFVLIPHPGTNSIYVVSNPFIVERTLAILENLDINEGRTKIFDLENLQLRDEEQRRAAEATARARAGGQFGTGAEGPFGIGGGGVGLPGGLLPGVLSSAPQWTEELPAGHIERTLFYIHKLKYRMGDQIEIALRKIADSLQLAGTTNADLISTINSIQWLESSNSLIFTGTTGALDRIRELIDEIDTPLREVFIEMLILDTTISDSLRYGVEWATRFGGGSTVGAQAFLNDPNSPVNGGLDSTGLGTAVANPGILARTEGYHLGVIGRHITHNGLHFATLGALVTAVHTDTRTHIVLNPKIIAEDNHTAEIFVGETARYKTQSISNDFGTVLTNNFQFIDIGTTLRVTPLIGNNDIITLDIVQEVTNALPQANAISSAAEANINLVPVLTKSRTVTKVHMPNGFFVILSGMIQGQESVSNNRIPCLGGIPILGAANKFKTNSDDKRNLLIFMRPLIVDSELEYEELTRRHQDIMREQNKFRRSWNYEIDEALDFANIKCNPPENLGSPRKY